MTELHDSPATAGRRAVVLCASAVGAGVVLSACGGNKPSAANPTSTGDTKSASADVTVKTADVPVGGGVVIKDAKVVVTQPQPGQYEAFSAVCTHKQCLVATVSDRTIQCPCHGSRFNIANGAAVKGPATQALSRKTATLNGDTISIT
jgi:Rieske Fe-S protein